MRGVDLAAHWIGLRGEEVGVNVTFLARRKFQRDKVSASSILRIAADSRYILYLNGERLGLGPARSSRKRFFYDSYEISTRLRVGANYLAVEVHCPVTPTFTVAPVRPALFVQIDDWLVSDASWEVQRDPSRNPASPLYTFQTGYSELRDLREELRGWQTFSDGAGADWQPATILADAHALGGRSLVERDIPALETKIYSYRKMVNGGAVPRLPHGAEDELNFADRVHGELHFHVDLPHVETMGEEICIHPSRTTRGAFCILDFQREVVGSVMIDLDVPAGTILDLAYSESLEGGRVLARKFLYNMADRYILPEGRQRLECVLHDRGFRFLQLVFRRFDRPVIVHSVKAVDRRFPLPVKAEFQCDDEFLNRLWSMCEETVSACSLDTFVDCPWREQALWLNDLLVIVPLYLSLTGDRQLPARCLRLAFDGQQTNGLIPVVPPADGELFSSMPALAAIILSDYYLYTGDLELVRELMPGLQRSLAVYKSWQDADGLIPYQEGIPNFIDWGYSSDASELGGTTAILNLLIAAAYRGTAQLLEALGDDPGAAERRRDARALGAAVVEKLWRADLGRFTDCIGVPNRVDTVSQHPHAVGLFFDLIPESLREDALAALTDPRVVEAELYFQHYVISALARNGGEEKSLIKIRELWGEMVAEGSPTVWESHRGSYAFEGCGSLCHAFSCTPMYFMQTVVLGVRPLSPGFREFSFDPRPLDSECCRGRVPTPAGWIDVEWRQGGYGLEMDLSIPDGLVAVLPDGRRLGGGAHQLRPEMRSLAEAI